MGPTWAGQKYKTAKPKLTQSCAPNVLYPIKVSTGYA